MKLPLFCLWFLGTCALPGGEVRSFKNAEQDATGKVWALNRGYRDEPLVVFEKDDWKPFPLPEGLVPEKAEPLCMAKLRDGAVAILWRGSPGEIIVTRHQGGESSQIARGPLAIPEKKEIARLFVDSKGRLWITDLAPVLYRIETDGSIKTIHTFKEEDFYVESRGGSRSAHTKYNPLGLLEDQRGRIWLWSDRLRGYSNYLSLKGVLIVEGETARLQALGTLKTLVGIVDAGPLGLWAASRWEGICKIDPETFAATPIPPPEPGAFDFVSQILLFENKPVIVAATGSDAEVRLWSLKSLKSLKDDRWHDWFAPKKKDEEDPLKRGYGNALSLLPLKNGVILYGDRERPRFLQDGKAPVALDWRSGFPLRGASNAFTLRDGSLLIGSYHGKPALPPKINPSPRTTLIEARNLFFDPSGDAWWISYEEGGRVYHWSRGKIAAHHPFPDGFHTREHTRQHAPLASDNGRRLWLIPLVMEGKVAVFDTGKREWTTFPGLHAAFQAFLDDPPRFPKQDITRGIPYYSADGRRITFYVDSEIHYFDGKEWRKFKKADVGLKKSIGVPFFDSEDTLCLLYYKEVYRQTESGPWTRIGPSIRPRENRQAVPNFPEKKDFSPNIWPKGDSHGTYWFTSGGQLYRLRPGLPPVRVFGEGENQPFLAGRRASEIRLHPEGWAFLGDDDSIVILAPKFPLPECEIRIHPKEPSSVQVAFESRTGVHFEWRIDGGEWQLTDEKSVTVSGLTGGRHRVEVVARDSALQAQMKPSVKEFEVDLPIPPLVRVPPFTPEVEPERAARFTAETAPATPEQINAWIGDLADDDFDKRSAAIASLARHRAAALPALRAVLEKEHDSDKSWWLKAAIQEAASPSAP